MTTSPTHPHRSREDKTGYPKRPVVIVTGGAKRVGRAICLELAAAGYDIILTYHTSQNEAEVTTKSCRDLGSHVEAHRLDLADCDAAERWANRITNAFSKISAIIHNASRYTQTPWGQISEEEMMLHYRTNVVSPILITQCCSNSLAAATGSVVVMGDIHAMGLPRTHMLAYIASKAAATEIVHTLAHELAPDIRVNGIAPGVVEWHTDTDPQFKTRYENRTPLKRSGSPNDVAKLVRFLIDTDTSPFITGTIIPLDGGRRLR